MSGGGRASGGVQAKPTRPSATCNDVVGGADCGGPRAMAVSPAGEERQTCRPGYTRHVIDMNSTSNVSKNISVG